MTYNEFKERVEEFGIYKLIDTGEGYSEIYYDAMYEEEDYLIGSVSHEQECTMDIIAENLTDIKLVELMLEYVLTPIAERFVLDLYYLKLNLPKTLKDEPQFYTQVITPNSSYYTLSNLTEKPDKGIKLKTKFTAGEVLEITCKENMDSFNITLPEDVEE